MQLEWTSFGLCRFSTSFEKQTATIKLKKNCLAIKQVKIITQIIQVFIYRGRLKVDIGLSWDVRFSMHLAQIVYVISTSMSKNQCPINIHEQNTQWNKVMHKLSVQYAQCLTISPFTQRKTVLFYIYKTLNNITASK